jgi:hypothetical protein
MNKLLLLALLFIPLVAGCDDEPFCRGSAPCPTDDIFEIIPSGDVGGTDDTSNLDPDVIGG